MRKIIPLAIIATILSIQHVNAQFGKLKSNVDKAKNATSQAEGVAEKAKNTKEQVDGTSSEVSKK